MTRIEKLCTDLECNIIFKRHSQTGRWDARVSHAWFHNPLLSVSSDTAQGCLDALNERVEALEDQRVGIERKNAQRNDKFAKQEKDQWVEGFWK